MDSAGRVAPSVARNREAILDVLRAWLPPRGTVLEVASGTGEHAVFFAAALPGVAWQPTDRDAEARASVEAWRRASGVANVLPPLALDAAEPSGWPVRAAEAVVAINMIHIAPWAAAEGLVAGAASVLPPGGMLVLYGPFREGGAMVASNAAFDLDLRGRDPAWGIRDLEAVAGLAAGAGMALAARVPMPANNLAVVFRRGD